MVLGAEGSGQVEGYVHRPRDERACGVHSARAAQGRMEKVEAGAQLPWEPRWWFVT